MSELFPEGNPKGNLNDYINEQDDVRYDQPLAARLRPTTIDDIAGQQHILGKGKLLRRAIEADRFSLNG